MTKLASDKDYAQLSCQIIGANAFFAREDLTPLAGHRKHVSDT